MRSAFLAAMFCLCGTPLRAERPVLVGEYSDASRLVIEGCAHFTADSIRSAVASNLDLVVPSRPTASLATYEQMLQFLITEGYRADGFADARVTVGYEEPPGAVVVHVIEGQQYHCGEVRVSGVSEELAETLRHALIEKPTSPQLEPPAPGVVQATLAAAMLNQVPNPSSVPEWRPGTPADIRSAKLRDVQALVKGVLNGAGWWNPRLSASFERNPEALTASLTIKVIDPGRHAVISNIIVEGNQRDSRESILSHLGLREGLPYSGELERTLATRLWDSGRYRDAEWALASASDDSGSLSLRIRVWEYSAAPSLDRPLDDIDQTLVKAAHWLSRVGDSEFDVIVSGESELSVGKSRSSGRRSFKSNQWQYIVSGRRGFLHLSTPIPADDSAAMQFAAAMEPQQLRLHSGLTHHSLVHRLPRNVALQPCLRLLGLREIGSRGEQVILSFGLGLRSTNRPPGSPQFTMQAAPVVLLDARYRNRSETSLQDGRLMLENETNKLTIDQESGQVTEWVVSDRETTEPLFTIQTRRNAFEQAWLDLAQSAPGDEQWSPEINTTSGTIDWSEEFSAVMEFLDGDVSPGARVAANLIGDELEQWSGFEMDLADSGPPVFRIPTNDRLGDNASLRGFFQAAVHVDALLFRPTSRPSKLIRELFAGIVLHDPEASPNLQSLLESPDNGPLMYWYAAEIFRFLNPPMSQRLAAAGLGRLETDRFLHDVTEFTGPQALSTGLAADVLTRLRGLSRDDRDVLLALFGDPARQARMSQIITDESCPIGDTITRLLGELWETRLRDAVRTRLGQIQGTGDVRTTSIRRAALPGIGDNVGG